MNLESIFFTIFAAVGVISALLVVTGRNPIISALWLIVNFFCLSGLYLTLHAQFVAVIQILVYAGAVMVLFVFVIMLLNLGDEQRLRDAFSWKKVIAAGLGFGVFMELIYAFMIQGQQYPFDELKAANIGTVEYIGSQLFTTFLFPFEITSLLLTAAIICAVVLAKKKFD